MVDKRRENKMRESINRSKHAFITGATGFVGNALINYLFEDGYAISAFVRKTSNLCGLPENIELIYGDLSELDETILNKIKQVIDENTILFHVGAILGAAQASKSNYMKTNVEATSKLLTIAIQQKIKKFVFISSMGAAGPQGSYDTPMDETTIENPRGYYSVSKLLAEKHIFENAPKELPVIIFRPPNIFGPNMNPKSGAAIVFAGCGRKIFAIIGRGNNYVNFAYIDNVIDGIITCTENTNQGHELFFISDDKPYKLIELINEIKSQLGSKTKIMKFPYILIFPFAWITEQFSKLIRRGIGFNTELVKGLATNAYLFSIDKAKSVGFAPKVSLKDGVKNTIEFLGLENK